MKTLFLAALAAFSLASEASAQIAISSPSWQVLPSQRLKRKEAKTIERLALPPGTIGEPVAAVVILKNTGKKLVPGVLVRYAASARVVPVGNHEEEGIWTVPFWTEQERVPQIGGGKEKRLVVRNLHLDAYLRQLLREGYWVKTLKVQVMVEPKRGENLTNKMLETELPVDWIGKNP